LSNTDVSREFSAIFESNPKQPVVSLRWFQGVVFEGFKASMYCSMLLALLKLNLWAQTLLISNFSLTATEATNCASKPCRRISMIYTCKEPKITPAHLTLGMKCMVHVVCAKMPASRGTGGGCVCGLMNGIFALRECSEVNGFYFPGMYGL
jgi:hypothetical protein